VKILLFLTIVGWLFFPVYSGAEDLEYSTYLGGSMDDAVFAMDISSSGDIYLTGTTTSSDFPTMAAWISSFPGPLDPEDRKECCYLTRLDSTGAKSEPSGRNLVKNPSTPSPGRLIRRTARNAVI